MYLSIIINFRLISGQTAPRQPAVIQEEQMVVHKEEIQEVEEEEEVNQHNEVIIGGL